MERRKPTAEEYEQLFWTNVRGDYTALLAMDDDLIPTPDDVQKRLDAGFRLTFKCCHCPDDHTVHGTYEDMAVAVQVLLLRGINRVVVEETHQAQASDDAKAEALIAKGAVPDLLSETLSKRKP